MSVATDEPTAFQEAAALLLELHYLMEQGKSETDEANEVRDRMEANWEKLDDVKRARIRGLSADLYSLGDDSPIVHPPGSHVRTERASKELTEAELREDWDSQLEFLRINPDEVGADLAAYIRGFCWTKLGLREVGMLFLERAAGNDAKFRPPIIIWMIEAGREAEAIELCRDVFNMMRQFDPVRVFTIASACSIIATRIAKSKEEQLEWIDRVIQATEYGQSEYPNWQYPSDLDYLRSPGARHMYETLAWCYLVKGDLAKTRRACNEALKLAPDDRNLKMLELCLEKQTNANDTDPVVLEALGDRFCPSPSIDSIPLVDLTFGITK